MKVDIEIKTAELHNRFINVIKLVRAITGFDLKESKNFVDELRAKNPLSDYPSVPSKVVFSLNTNETLEDIKLFINKDGLDAKVIPFSTTSDLKDFKGCFNMISSNKIQLYLENGENNKLSMIVEIGRMQEMIKMFVDNCQLP